jgi:NIPSNAP
METGMDAERVESDVVELRRYTLHPGRRDELIDLFDREFLETQEAVGAGVLGQFRDLDRPDTFVWLRGFADMAGRREALTAFYGGPVWGRHSAAANATMVDWSDVRLLRPAGPGTAVPVRPRGGSGAADLFTVTVLPLPPAGSGAAVDLFRLEVEPALAALGAPSVALLVTEPSPNDYPALPIRGGEVVVRISRHPGVEAEADFRKRRADDPEWLRLQGEMERRGVGPALELRLQPTSRSRLR